MNIEKVFAIISLGVAFILLGPFIYHHVGKRENESRWSLYGIVFALFLAIILSLVEKGNDISIEDLICLLMIIMALILTFLARSNNWGFTTSLMSIGIAVLGTIQLIVGASNLNKKID
jgi:hypothetical protein